MPRRSVPQKHQPYQHAAPCERKRRFATEADAHRAIEIAELADMQLTLQTYQCPYCQKWHLSSRRSTPRP